MQVFISYKIIQNETTTQIQRNAHREQEKNLIAHLRLSFSRFFRSAQFFPLASAKKKKIGHIITTAKAISAIHCPIDWINTYESFQHKSI